MSLPGCVRFTQTEISGGHIQDQQGTEWKALGLVNAQVWCLSEGGKKKGMAPGHFCMYWGKIVKHVSAKHRYRNRVKSHLPLLHCHSLKSSLSKMSAACHAEWFKWEESGVQERALLFFNSEVSNTTLFKAACETVLVLRMPNDDSLNF